jgi:formylglycine-generating enzyme required for sulfatase activity
VRRSLLATALLVAGCFDVTEPQQPSCSKARPGCPAGMTCDEAQGLCVRRADGGAGDASRSDARRPDARQPDGPKPDAKLDAPKPDAPKPDAPKPDAKPDAPKPDAPKPDAPAQDAKPDAPKLDAPKPDAPKLDAPKLEGPKPGDGPDAGYVPGWITVSAGSFQMGSPWQEPCRQTNEALHNVTLTHQLAFRSQETTQGDFVYYMKYNPSSQQGPGKNTAPVEMVSWHEAAAYCNALSGVSKPPRPPCYSCTGTLPNVTCVEQPTYAGALIYKCRGYRLPTEAEWEYAYRAGSSTAFYNGPIGSACQCNQADSNASKIGWYDANSGSMTQPAATLAPNAWGIHDMAGNVSEWVNDGYQDTLVDMKNPWGAASPPAADRVVRGGSRSSCAHNLRAAWRDNYPPSTRDALIGFRCARTIDPNNP